MRTKNYIDKIDKRKLHAKSHVNSKIILQRQDLKTREKCQNLD